jgi:hypothetical protein
MVAQKKEAGEKHKKKPQHWLGLSKKWLLLWRK